MSWRDPDFSVWKMRINAHVFCGRKHGVFMQPLESDRSGQRVGHGHGFYPLNDEGAEAPLAFREKSARYF